MSRSDDFEFAPIEDHVQRLGRTRNCTYLEHGYERVQSDQAQRSFDWSLPICRQLLGEEIAKLWQRFEMRF